MGEKKAFDFEQVREILQQVAEGECDPANPFHAWVYEHFRFELNSGVITPNEFASIFMYGYHAGWNDCQRNAPMYLADRRNPSPMKKDRSDLIAFYQSGKTMMETAKAFGLSRERVRTILKSRGIDTKSGGRYPALRERRQATVADYQAGMTIKELAAKYNLPCYSVYEDLVALNVPRRPRSGVRRKPERDQALVDYFKSGATYDETAKRFGMVRSNVQRILKRAGVSRRGMK